MTTKPAGSDDITADLDEEQPPRPRRPHVLMFCGDTVSTHALPDSGVLVVGRQTDADIVVNDATVSRRHVQLHIGPPLRLENLSSGATSARGRRLGLGVCGPG